VRITVRRWHGKRKPFPGATNDECRGQEGKRRPPLYHILDTAAAEGPHTAGVHASPINSIESYGDDRRTPDSTTICFNPMEADRPKTKRT
jgi:hypothetical protein